MQLRINILLVPCPFTAAKDNPFHYINFIKKVNSMYKK